MLIPIHVLICLKVTFTWFFIIFQEEPRRTKKCLEHCWTTHPCQFPWLSLKIICRDMHANVRCKTWRWLNIWHILCLGSQGTITRVTVHIIFCHARSVEARARTANSREETGAVPVGRLGKGVGGRENKVVSIFPCISMAKFYHDDWNTWPNGVS